MSLYQMSLYQMSLYLESTTVYLESERFLDLKEDSISFYTIGTMYVTAPG